MPLQMHASEAVAATLAFLSVLQCVEHLDRTCIQTSKIVKDYGVLACLGIYSKSMDTSIRFSSMSVYTGTVHFLVRMYCCIMYMTSIWGADACYKNNVFMPFSQTDR